MELSELKSEIESLKQDVFSPTKFRYPNDIKQKIRLINSQGTNIQKISRYLNIPHQTIRNWSKVKIKKTFNKSKFKELKVKPIFEKELKSDFYIETRSGHKIKNLSYPQFVQILKEDLL